MFAVEGREKMKQAARLSIDVGGTFTDVVLEHLGGRDCFKLLTTPDAPEIAFLQGVGTILERTDVVAEDVDLVIHGTTLATNALIERKGAQTALLTTDGFRDSIEIAYEHRFEQYDLYMEQPHPWLLAIGASRCQSGSRQMDRSCWLWMR